MDVLNVLNVLNVERRGGYRGTEKSGSRHRCQLLLAMMKRMVKRWWQVGHGGLKGLEGLRMVRVLYCKWDSTIVP